MDGKFEAKQKRLTKLMLLKENDAVQKGPFLGHKKEKEKQSPYEIIWILFFYCKMDKVSEQE